MSQQNTALVRHVIEEVWNQGNFAVADEVIANDWVGHMPARESHGPEGYKQFFIMLRQAFPDIHFTIEDEIAGGDRVVTRWTSCATHRGEFMGVPPTGRPGTVTGISINRIADGKFVEGWTNLDELGLLRQLGMHAMAGQPG